MLAIFVPAMLYACWNDYRFHRIPNWLNVTIIVTGLGSQMIRTGWAGLETGLMGMLVGFSMLILLWAIKGMGAGDVKYMAAMGAWLGPDATFYAVVVGALIGGVIALMVLVLKKNWSQTTANIGVLLVKMSSAKSAFSDYGSAEQFNRTGFALPYAIPLTLGALGVVLTNNTIGWVML